MAAPLRVLISAFEPFDNRAINASAAVLERLIDLPPAGCELLPLLLPVVGGIAPRRLVSALRRQHPHVAIALGEAAGASAIAVERIAINLRDYAIPDNAGRQVRDRPVVRGAALALESTLPVKAVVASMHAAGIPALVSYSAGTYLCNEVMYALLHAVDGTIPAGFIHVPLVPEQVDPRTPRPSMSAETAATALRAALT